MELDFEGAADALYREAGYDDGAPAPILGLAKRLLGPGALHRVHAGALRADAALVTVQGERRIYVRRGLSQPRLRFAVAHELAHWALGLDSSCRENEEQCNALAACLVAPRRAFLRALRETELYKDLAERFVTTESCAALRQAEVTGEPTALVCPHTIYVRGDEWIWPAERELRALAARGGPGIRKARLKDDRRRVAVRAG